MWNLIHIKKIKRKGALTHPQPRKGLWSTCIEHSNSRDHEPKSSVQCLLFHCRYHCPWRQQSPFIKWMLSRICTCLRSHITMGQDETGTWFPGLPASALSSSGWLCPMLTKTGTPLCLPLRQSWGQGCWLLTLLPLHYDNAWATAAGTFVGIGEGKDLLHPSLLIIESKVSWETHWILHKRLWVMTGNRGTHLMICFLKSPFLESHCVGNQPQWRQQALESLTCSESQGEAS